MTKRQMMKSAHRIAREIVYAVKNYMIALKLALKEVWRQVKLYDKKRFGTVAIINAAARLTETKREKEAKKYVGDLVPTWIIDKNLSANESYALCAEANPAFKTVHETEKAVLLSAGTEYGTVEFWCPKSVLKK